MEFNYTPVNNELDTNYIILPFEKIKLLVRIGAIYLNLDQSTNNIHLKSLILKNKENYLIMSGTAMVF